MLLLACDKSCFLYKLILGLNFVLSCGIAPPKSVQLSHYGTTGVQSSGGVLLYERWH